MEELGALVETGGVAALELAASAMAERGAEAPPCPSCGKPMIGPFCAICGQPRNTHRRSLRHLVHEVVKDIVSFDSRILRTARALLFRPGELPAAFRQGRTQPYVPAVRLYLFVSLLFFLFLSVTGLAFLQLGFRFENVVYSHNAAGQVFVAKNGHKELVKGLKSDKDGNLSLADPKVVVDVPKEKADGRTTAVNFTGRILFFERLGQAKNEVPPEVNKTLAKMREEAAKLEREKKDGFWALRGLAAALTKLQTDPAALNAPLTAWIPRVLFVLLPLFAALLALFYRGLRKDYLFVDHLVFSLTMHSFAFVLLIGAAILAQVMGGGWVALIAWVLLSAYFLISLKVFYRQGWGRTAVKFAGISFVYAVFCLTPAISFAIVASLIGFQ